MNMDKYNMTPSEKLTSLLDGETTGIDTSEVFYDLSNSPELQQEFLDLMKMRQLMSGGLEAPPEHLRRGIMAGIGLGGGGLWYGLQNSGMVAATGAFLTSKVGAALVAGMFGVLATFMIMNNSNGDKREVISNDNKAKIESLANAMPIVMEVPVVSSLATDNGSSNRLANSVITTNRNTSNSSKYSPNTKANLGNGYSAITTTKRNSSNTSNLTNAANSDFVSITNSPQAYESQSSSDAVLQRDESTDLAYNHNFKSNLGTNQNSGFIVNPTNRKSVYEDEQQMLFSLQGKGITNNSLTTPDQSTTEAPSINNLGIALMYSVNENFALGLEFGQEFFVKRIRTNSFNSEESMLDNQLTFWGGLKASYTFNELEIVSNLKPTTSLLLGGTSSGWITKASAGLVYDISNKMAVFGGPEWTTGFYQFDSNVLSTHKWGFNYGIALKF